jgi:hypothetical protein
MPVYFFDVLDSDWLIEDHDGQDLPDTEAARAVAIRRARDQIAVAAKEGKDVAHRQFRVRVDPLVFNLSFRDALPQE